MHRSRIAITAFFFVNGLVFASWVPHIPAVKARLALTDAQLGLLLLAMGIGALTALSLAGWIVSRFGSRRVTVASAWALCALLLPLVLSNWVAAAAACLFLFGAATATLDVAMNAQAAELEASYGRSIMSSFHGFYSLGGLLGAALAGGLMAAAVSAPLHALAVLAGCLAAVAVCSPRLLPVRAEPRAVSAIFVRPNGATVVLGLLSLAALLVEGAIGDWSAVYLRDTLAATPAVAAMGFAAFSLTMATGRFVGDALAHRMGRRRLLQVSGATAAAGLAASAAGDVQLALVGFGLAGIGLANVIPVLFSAAGRVGGSEPGRALAAVASTGYFGYLAGPPLVGLTGELFGLRLSMLLLGLLCGAIALRAPRTQTAR